MLIDQVWHHATVSFPDWACAISARRHPVLAVTGEDRPDAWMMLGTVDRVAGPEALAGTALDAARRR